MRLEVPGEQLRVAGPRAGVSPPPPQPPPAGPPPPISELDWERDRDNEQRREEAAATARAAEPEAAPPPPSSDMVERLESAEPPPPWLCDRCCGADRGKAFISFDVFFFFSLASTENPIMYGKTGRFTED